MTQVTTGETLLESSVEVLLFGALVTSSGALALEAGGGAGQASVGLQQFVLNKISGGTLQAVGAILTFVAKLHADLAEFGLGVEIVHVAAQ